MKQNRFKKFYYLLFVFLLALFAILVFYTRLPNVMDEKIYDILSHLKYKDKKISKNVVIVKIDDKSIASLGQWPWSRLILAKLMQKIQLSHPASIGVDVIFSEEDRTSPKNLSDFYELLGIKADFSFIPKALYDNDLVFAKELSYKNVVSPLIVSPMLMSQMCSNFSTLKSKGELKGVEEVDFISCNTKTLQKDVKSSGFINEKQSLDGLVRAYPLAYRYKDKLIPSFGVAMLNSVDKDMLYSLSDGCFKAHMISFLQHNIYANKQADVLNYLYSPNVFSSISAIDVLRGKYDKDFFSGKFVILGSTAIGLSDFYLNSQNEKVSGLYTHASFLEHVLNDDLVYKPSFSARFAYIFSFLLILFIYYLNYKSHYILSAFIGFSAVLIGLTTAYIWLFYGVYIGIGLFLSPLLVLYFILLLSSTYIWQIEENNYIKQSQNIRSSIVNNMMMMVETRDAETGKHIARTQQYAKILSDYLAKHSIYSNILSKEFRKNLYEATSLHDIGKIGIADCILQKPGKLTYDEMQVMKNHAQIGYDILSQTIHECNYENDFLIIASNIAYTHHEKWNGQGYPRGLKSEQIPLEGRIVALVDVYDALTNKRCYKNAFGFEQSEKIIIDGRGSHFDPVIVDAFVELKEEFRRIAKSLMD